MAVDHSQTYKIKSLRNLPHRLRLKAILSQLDTRKPSSDVRYADFGCSNGYITDIVARRYAITKAMGLDYEESHMEIARQHYPQIEFNTVNLNLPESVGSFDLVTCFETLEHVGDMENALSHLLSSTDKDGLLFITVPIETGFRGLMKYVSKSILYRQGHLSDLKEMSSEKIGAKYLWALLFNKDTSRFREKRQRWGTHYGFDYRLLDRVLEQKNVKYTTANHFTSRFYFIET